MHNKEAKKKVTDLYQRLAFDLDLLQQRKKVIDQISDAIDNDQFDEEYERILESLYFGGLH